jgi:hypothetical protein
LYFFFFSSSFFFFFSSFQFLLYLFVLCAVIFGLFIAETLLPIFLTTEARS